MEEDMILNGRQLRELAQTHGYIRVLVLLVKFQDHANRPVPSIEDFEELFNTPGLRRDNVFGKVPDFHPDPQDIIPTGSVADFLHVNSRSQFQIEAHVVDWTMTDNTERYYSFDRSGITTDLRKAMYPVLDKLDAEGFDFSRFDLNGDNVIDSIVLLHSGYAAEIGGSDCQTNANATYRIWSHAIPQHSDNWSSSRTGMRANGYCVSSGLRGRCGNQVARIGVITHEFIHTLGLPDLNDQSGDWIGRGLGEYDIMSNAHGRDGSQIYPAFLSPWSRTELGWLDPIEIKFNGVYEIEASELSGKVYVIRDKYPSDEYLLIENRQPLLWDNLLWSGGLLIWHIDDHANQLRNRGYPGMPGWPGSGDHYSIAVLGADGRFDLEVGVNGGDDQDYWRDGAALIPGPVEYVATSNGIYPNTNSYQGGNIRQTGIVIDQISSSGTTMTFRVSGLAESPSPTPRPSSHPTTAPTPRPTVLPTPAPSIVRPTNPPTAPLTEPPTSAPTPQPILSPLDLLPFFRPSEPPGPAPAPSNLLSGTNRPSQSPRPTQIRVAEIYSDFYQNVGASMLASTTDSGGEQCVPSSSSLLLCILTACCFLFD